MHVIALWRFMDCGEESHDFVLAVLVKHFHCYVDLLS